MKIYNLFKALSYWCLGIKIGLLLVLGVRNKEFVRYWNMAGVQDQLEIKFRLIDGSDIGPKSFPASASVANLKESILSQWPKG